LERTVSNPFRFGGGDFEFSPCRFAPNPSMLPSVATGILGSPSGFIALNGPHRVEGFFIGSALHGIKTSGFVFMRASFGPRLAPTTMASADFPRHLLRGISPGKNALLLDTTASFTSEV